MADFLLSMKHTLRAITTLPFIPNYQFALKTAQKRIDPRRLSYDRRTGELKVRGMGVAVTEGKNEFLLDVLRYVDDLVEMAGARFFETEDGTLIIDVKGVRAEVRTKGEIEVLWEVFAQDMYNLGVCDGRVIWDIGMNTGLAALFFAVCKKAKVYGYEPFPLTYTRAIANISLNPEYAISINTFMKGVAGSTCKVNADYDPTNHISNGLFGPTREPTGELQTVAIELVGAVEAFDQIVAENPCAPIVLKIDCEGAEFDIISALRAAGRLDRIEAVLMEWHIAGDPEGPKHLEDDLRSAGFSYITLSKTDRVTGLIYAFHSPREYIGGEGAIQQGVDPPFPHGEQHSISDEVTSCP